MYTHKVYGVLYVIKLCIVMKINWFSLIDVIVNCSVWSALAARYTRYGQA